MIDMTTSTMNVDEPGVQTDWKTLGTNSGILNKRGAGIDKNSNKKKDSIKVDSGSKSIPSANYALIRSGPTANAKLVTGESSRKSVNFRTFIVPGGNRDDVAIPLESIRAISE
ncbi:hypothetical protein Tco_0475676 [Tanacetum coccineum]